MTPMTDGEYLSKHGQHCPYCDSESLTYGSVEVGEQASQDVVCDACGRSWWDIYSLVSWEPMNDTR